MLHLLRLLLTCLSDPVALLDGVLNETARLSASKELEIENQRLRETVDEYQKEFAEIKNQGLWVMAST